MLVGLLVSLSVAASPQSLHVTVNGSIEASLSSLSPRGQSVLAAQVARLLRWRGDVVKNVHRGDSLNLLFEPGIGTEELELVAMSYRGSQINLSAYRFTGPDGIARYWDENGKLVEPTIINSPVERYVQITETVQRGRGKRPHAGMDFKAPEGTPVRLPFAATVTRVNWSRRINGNCIELELPNGRILHYLHLAKIAPEVKPTAALPAGTPLGEVGTTGHSNAPHLHYEILERDGHALEPMEVHGTGAMTLGPESLPAFQTARAAFDRSLAQGIARTEPAARATEAQGASGR